MSDYDDLLATQQETQEMLGDMEVFYGMAIAIAGAGIVGFIIWIGHQLL